MGAGQSLSRLGRTRTAPEEERIQFVLHLGDFIYERSWHTRSDGSPPSRRVPDFPGGVATDQYRYAVSLADYRQLYQTYLDDPYLQEARARWPFICTWDDHEFANDNFQSFTTYDKEPVLDARRKQSANQAGFEYIPAVLDELPGQPVHDFRPQALSSDTASHNQAGLDSLRIYRTLGWGKYLDIVLTDSRSYRTPPCLPEDLAGYLGQLDGAQPGISRNFIWRTGLRGRSPYCKVRNLMVMRPSPLMLPGCKLGHSNVQPHPRDSRYCHI